MQQLLAAYSMHAIGTQSNSKWHGEAYIIIIIILLHYINTGHFYFCHATTMGNN